MRKAFCLLILTSLVWADRVLPGAHFQKEIPMFPTMQIKSRNLGEKLNNAGHVYAVRNSWYYYSHQPPLKVAEFYSEHLAGADRQALAPNHLVFTIHPAQCKPLDIHDGTNAYEFIEVEIADLSSLNQVLNERERSAKCSIHISEYLAP
ncbi:hypothetical protein JST97_01585 [bacterium]|nr:hypothetical protein [bacterium]